MLKLTEKYNKYRTVFMFLLMLAFYIIAFWPVLRSGYMNDDLHNYNLYGLTLIQDTTVLKSTIKSIIRTSGRSDLFSSCIYIFFYIVKDLVAYKLVIVISTFINGLVLGKIIYLLSESERLYWLNMLLFPVTISLDCSFFNSMYGFHILLQSVFLVSMLGVLNYIKYMQTEKKAYQVISCVFLFFALGIYEVSYVLCGLYFIIALFMRKKLFKAIKSIIPQICVGYIWLAYTMYLRSKANIIYGGINVGSNSKKFIGGFFRQLSGTSCFFNNVLTLRNTNDEQLSDIFEVWLLRYIAVILIAIICFLLIFSNRINYKDERSDGNLYKYSYSNMLLFVLGIWIIIGPTILMALSARWQNDVQWGKGYLPAYVSCHGVTLCISLFLNWIGCHLNKKKLFISVIGILTAITVFPNQIAADISVNYVGNSAYTGDKLITGAKSTGIFDILSDDEIIVDGNDRWRGWLQNTPYLVAASWSRLFERKMDVCYYLYLYNKSGEELIYSDQYNKIIGNGGHYYYANMLDNMESLIFAECDNINIELSDNGSVDFTSLCDKFYVYVPNDSESRYVIIFYNDNSAECIDLSKMNYFSSSKRGDSYLISTNKKFDIYNVMVKSKIWVYSFVDKISTELNAGITDDEKLDIAIGIVGRDENACEAIWQWMENCGFDDESVINEEYISFIYANILGRTESPEENQNWVNGLNNNITRKEVFMEFINSPEFRYKYQI